MKNTKKLSFSLGEESCGGVKHTPFFIGDMMDYNSLIQKLASPEGSGVIRPALPGKTPSRNAIIDLIKNLQALLFPAYFTGTPSAHGLSPEALLEKIAADLEKQIELVASFRNEAIEAREKTEIFLEKLPEIKDKLLKDIRAIYEGDPAAQSCEEVLLCYPGFYAISIFRLAHELYALSVPQIPRIMTEFAHEKTGIDIHAGAQIGEFFCIDHGTGIVIGETTVIGDHVKLYQGVTLGAKSFELDENGNPVKNIKRHPNIGSHVVIYANATILGGTTFVGDNTVIGGSVWLTHSVKAGSTVYYSPAKEQAEQ